MLGSPLLRAALALAVLLLLALPMRSFTAARAPAAAAPAAPTVPATPAHLEIVSTKVPFTFSVVHLGRAIWQGQSSASSVSKGIPLQIPKDGIDLLLHVEWPDAQPAAAKLVVIRDDGEPVERTIWGGKDAEDVLTFPGQ